MFIMNSSLGNPDVMYFMLLIPKNRIDLVSLCILIFTGVQDEPIQINVI